MALLLLGGHIVDQNKDSGVQQQYYLEVKRVPQLKMFVY